MLLLHGLLYFILKTSQESEHIILSLREKAESLREVKWQVEICINNKGCSAHVPASY